MVWFGIKQLFIEKNKLRLKKKNHQTPKLFYLIKKHYSSACSLSQQNIK